MGHLSQLVLLASIVASCISYSIDSTKIMSVPEPPEEPLESDFSEFPYEFMKNLIASMTPEEQVELQKPIILGESSLVDREGDTDKSPCRRQKDTQNYGKVQATDGEYYFVVGYGEATNRAEQYQSVIHYACDVKRGNDNKCEPAKAEKFAAYCCHQAKVTTSLYVLPLPTRYFDVRNGSLFLKGEHVKYQISRDKNIKKEVLLNSDCICGNLLSVIAYSGQDYSCPKPDSSLLL